VWDFGITFIEIPVGSLAAWLRLTIMASYLALCVAEFPGFSIPDCMQRPCLKHGTRLLIRDDNPLLLMTPESAS
jgi:hypothetical protein